MVPAAELVPGYGTGAWRVPNFFSPGLIGFPVGAPPPSFYSHQCPVAWFFLLLPKQRLNTHWASHGGMSATAFFLTFLPHCFYSSRIVQGGGGGGTPRATSPDPAPSRPPGPPPPQGWRG